MFSGPKIFRNSDPVRSKAGPMKKLMMFAALIAAGCTAQTSTGQTPDTDAGVEPDGQPVEPCLVGFLGCEGDVAKRCVDGLEITSEQCAAGCNSEAERCNECTPNAVTCTGDQLQTCGADGLVAATETCALGCSEGGEAQCAHLEPHYLPTVCDVPATQSALVFPSGQLNTLDTNVAANCTGGIIAQVNGPEVCVVRADTISIDGVLNVIGNRAIAFVADNALDVDNIVDVSARRRLSGPGGSRRQSGNAPAGGGGGLGGAGAGGKTPGGLGGGNSNNFPTAGGPAFDPFLAGVFDGGARATSVLQLGNNYRPTGGGGGGALMLVSCRGEVRMGGTIDASGGGGDRGGDGVAGSPLFTVHGGAGGGAGGYVVLQGAKVTVTGKLVANGGGGGGGCDKDECFGADGEDGGQVIARGGAAVGAAAGRGGNGGLDATLPQAGSDGASPGGGGGAVGRFQIFTPSGVAPVMTGTSQPAFEPNRTVETR